MRTERTRTKGRVECSANSNCSSGKEAGVLRNSQEVVFGQSSADVISTEVAEELCDLGRELFDFDTA